MPVFLAFVRGHNALEIGVTMLVTGVTQLLTAPIAVALEQRVNARLLTSLGFGLFGVGLGLSGLQTPETDFGAMFWPQVIRGLAIMFCLLPPTRLALGHLAASRVPDASGLFNLMRNLGGSVGVSFTTTMLQERTQFHHERLAEHITAYNGYGWPAPLGTIDAAIQGQAGIMSYLDIFWTLGLIALFLAPFALLLPAMPRGAVSSH